MLPHLHRIEIIRQARLYIRQVLKTHIRLLNPNFQHAKQTETSTK